MFKLTYQALIMMGLLFGWVVGKTGEIRQAWLRFGSSTVLMALLGSLMIFPWVAFGSYYGGFMTYRGLDGFDFLRQRYPEELEMINFLENQGGKKNMVEAVGDSYTETNFISAFSGVPTVQGWKVHEWLWRGGYDPVGQRDEEVRAFYEEGAKEEALSFIKKYDIGFVLVSAREREKYKKLNEKKIKGLGEVISFGKNYLVQVPNL